ncbi:MAG: S-layer homology domain-containing protein [Candidatus Margulisiibacteriota bacterium]
MRKYLILLFIVCLTLPGLAENAEKTFKLKDLPDDHWAASAVYDLVKLGVTKGYPDGTFRGDKPINRYEAAIFLSKLAKSIGSDDLKAEIKQLRDQVVVLQQAPKEELVVTGHYEGDWKAGNVLSSSGASREGVANYRLKMTAKKELSENADIKINLDTMDYGYFDDGSLGQPGRGLLATDLLDIESNINLNLSDWRLAHPVALKLTYGPGAKQHAADPTGAFPSEIGTTFVRPETGILASTKLFGADVKGGYYSLQSATLETSGQINTSRITGGLGFTLERFLLANALRIDLTGDYISSGLFSSNERSIKAKVDLLAPLGDKAQASTTIGLGKKNSQMMVAGSLALNDLWETGTVLTVKLAKIGAEYIDSRFAGEKFDLAGYDYFNRPYENATVNLGGELVQIVSDKAQLVGKGDVRLAGDYQYRGPLARLTAQGGIRYNLAPNVNFDAAYRVYHDKAQNDTSDLAQVGLLYKF